MELYVVERLMYVLLITSSLELVHVMHARENVSSITCAPSGEMDPLALCYALFHLAKEGHALVVHLLRFRYELLRLITFVGIT